MDLDVRVTNKLEVRRAHNGATDGPYFGRSRGVNLGEIVDERGLLGQRSHEGEEARPGSGHEFVQPKGRARVR